MLYISLAANEEICRELGSRLKAQRLARNLSQQELAARAGVSAGTVKNLENKGQSSLESLVRIVSALDLVEELGGLFVLRTGSIAEMERAEPARRSRASGLRKPG